MLRARRISPRDSRRSGMPLNVYGWCEVVFLESHSRRGNPLYGPPDSVARAHPAVRWLSDSIVPEALLSDGQEFVRMSRSSALIQMIARLDEVLTSS